MKELKLGEFARKTETVNPKKFPDETFDLLSIPAFDRGEPEIASGNEIGSTKQLVIPGDVLIAKIVPHIQRVWVVPEADSRRQIASGEWIVFRNPEADPSWLRQLLLSQTFHRKFMQTVAGVGGSLLRARPVDVFKIPITVPPIKDQRRIADILDKADALRAKRREAIAHLDSLSQSIFHEMFSGFAESTTVPLENLAAAEKGSIRTGPFGSQLLTSEFTDSGIAVLGIDNTVDNRFSWKQRRFISTEKFEKLKRYTVHPGDVVITIMGTLGRCAVIPDDIPAAINTKHLCCITLDREKAHPVFLHSYFLQHPVAVNYLRQTTKGSIMGGLNMGIIKSMPVIQPPLKLQTKFARRMAIIDSLRSQQQAQLAELDSLFMSLQDRAFKGDL